MEHRCGKLRQMLRAAAMQPARVGLQHRAAHRDAREAVLDETLQGFCARPPRARVGEGALLGGGLRAGPAGALPVRGVREGARPVLGAVQ
eukprot:9691782-Alexandrium_andersonii.AAC.1